MKKFVSGGWFTTKRQPLRRLRAQCHGAGLFPGETQRTQGLVSDLTPTRSHAPNLPFGHCLRFSEISSFLTQSEDGLFVCSRLPMGQPLSCCGQAGRPRSVPAAAVAVPPCWSWGKEWAFDLDRVRGSEVAGKRGPTVNRRHQRIRQPAAVSPRGQLPVRLTPPGFDSGHKI